MQPARRTNPLLTALVAAVLVVSNAKDDTCPQLKESGGVYSSVLGGFRSTLHHHLPVEQGEVKSLCGIASSAPVVSKLDTKDSVLHFPYVATASCPSGSDPTFGTCLGAPYLTDPIIAVNSSQGALSVWFKWQPSTGSPSQAPLLAVLGVDNSTGLRIYLTRTYTGSENTINIVTDTSSGDRYWYTYSVSASSDLFEDGLWHHLMLNCDGMQPGYQMYLDTRPLPLTAVVASPGPVWLSSFGGAATVLVGGDIDKFSGQARYGGGFDLWALKLYSQALGACESALTEYEVVRQAILDVDPTGFGAQFDSGWDTWWLYDQSSATISVIRGTLLSSTPQRYQAYCSITKSSGAQSVDVRTCLDSQSQVLYTSPGRCGTYGNGGPSFSCVTPTAFFGTSTPSAVAVQQAAAQTVAATTVAASVTSSVITSAVTTQVSAQMGIIGLGQQATSALASSMVQVGIQPLVDGLQVFALQAHMPVTLAPTYATLATAVRWVNFDLNLGLGSKSSMSSKRRLAEQAEIPSSRRTLQSIASIQAQAAAVSAAWKDEVWASAGTRLFAIFAIGVLVVGLHSLAYLAWRHVSFLKKKPLPTFLVFPRIELIYLGATYIGMSEALGMLLGTGQVKGVVVGAIVLAYLALITSMLYFVLRKLIWHQDKYGLEYKVHNAKEGASERSCLANFLFRCQHGEWEEEVGLDKAEPGRSQQYLDSGFSLVHIARLLRRDKGDGQEGGTVARNKVLPIDAVSLKVASNRSPASPRPGGKIAAVPAGPRSPKPGPASQHALNVLYDESASRASSQASLLPGAVSKSPASSTGDANDPQSPLGGSSQAASPVAGANSGKKKKKKAKKAAGAAEGDVTAEGRSSPGPVAEGLEVYQASLVSSPLNQSSNSGYSSTNAGLGSSAAGLPPRPLPCTGMWRGSAHVAINVDGADSTGHLGCIQLTTLQPTPFEYTAPKGGDCNALQFSQSHHWRSLISRAEHDPHPAGPVGEGTEKEHAADTQSEAGGSESGGLLHASGDEGEDPKRASTRIETMERFGGLFQDFRGTSFAAGCFLAVQMALKLLMSLVIGVGHGMRSQPGSAGGYGVCIASLLLQLVYTCVLTFLRPQTDRIKWVSESLAAWMTTWAALCTLILQVDTYRVVQDLMLLCHLISLAFQLSNVWVLTTLQAAFTWMANSQAKAIIDTLPADLKAQLQEMAWPSPETVWDAVRSVAGSGNEAQAAAAAVQTAGGVLPSLLPIGNESRKDRDRRLAREAHARKKALHVVRATRQLPDSLKNSPYLSPVSGRSPVSSSEPSLSLAKRQRSRQGTNAELGNRLLALAQEREANEAAGRVPSLTMKQDEGPRPVFKFYG